MASSSHVSRFRQRKNDGQELTPERAQSLKDVSAILRSVANAIRANSFGFSKEVDEFLMGGDTPTLPAQLQEVLTIFENIAVSSMSFEEGKPVTTGVVRFRLEKAKDTFSARIRDEFPADALNALHHEKSSQIYWALETLFSAMCNRIENRAKMPVKQEKS